MDELLTGSASVGVQRLLCSAPLRRMVRRSGEALLPLLSRLAALAPQGARGYAAADSVRSQWKALAAVGHAVNPCNSRHGTPAPHRRPCSIAFFLVDLALLPNEESFPLCVALGLGMRCPCLCNPVASQPRP